MKNILFVCTGNTCRSPMAEGLLRKAARDAGADICAISAGTSAYAPGRAEPFAVQAASELGADISGHTPTPVTQELLGIADAVYCMARGHLETLKHQYPQYAFKLRTLDPDGDVGDPIGGSQEIYRQTAARIKALVDSLVGHGR